MINAQLSPTSSTIVRSADLPKTPKPSHSVASRVVELFHVPHAQTPSTQAHAIPPHARQRIEALLRYAVTKEQPSLAEQLAGLIKDKREPLTDSALHNTVEQHLNQPSTLDPQKTYAQLIEHVLQSPAPAAENVPPSLSRSRRDLQNPAVAPASRNEAIRKFAEALVDRGDRKLAVNVANCLVRLRLDNENGNSNQAQYKIAVTPDSTFGQALNKLADALESEPFKSFAEARNLDISRLFIGTDGVLTEIAGETPKREFHLHRDRDWAAASSAVLAAANKLATANGDGVRFYGRNHANVIDVARHYGIELDRINSEETLLTTGRLSAEGTFPALSNTDPLYSTQYAPVKQRQREAIQNIVALAPQQLNQRLEAFAPTTMAQTVHDADQTLAQLCSLGLVKLIENTGSHADPELVKDIPEYSTFNLVRKNLLDALTGNAFKTFARENNLDPTSVRINPDSGELVGKVRGVDTTFTLNDVSGWADVWNEIKPEVQQMANGTGAEIGYPSMASASLYQVMRFYNEEYPRQVSTQTYNWRDHQRVAILERSAQITQNNGFQALTTPRANDSRSQAVQELQQAVTQQLADSPASQPPMQTLAAAVNATAQNATAPADTQVDPERQLAAAMHRAMLELKIDATDASSKTLESIPPTSLFGQWRAYLGKALKGRGFTEWAKKQNIDLSSLRFDPTDKALIGKVNGIEQRFTAADVVKRYPEYFDVLTPVLTAAEIFTAQGKPITLSHANESSAPFEWVAHFHGISTDSDSAQFAQATESMGRTQQFPTPPQHPEKIVNWLNRQRTILGNSNDRFALIEQLKKPNAYNDNHTRFIVDADSSHQPKGATTLQKFLADQGWYPATTAAETNNLLRALQTQVPQPPALGNNWGFLSTALPLSIDQRDKVSAFIKEAIAPQNSLLSYLSANIPQLSTNPAQALNQLLSSSTALELASNLETALKGASTETSLSQWLLTALVLELDPAASATRNTVAGYDFMKPENWGLGADRIAQQFDKHLTDNKQVPANLAPVAAHALLSGIAPHLLVRNIPATLTLGSPEWVSFTTAVNRIELIAPGATAGMAYQQVMDLHKILPVSAGEAHLQAIAQMNPVIDWAIANNHLIKNDKDEYTLEQLAQSQEKLQKQVKDTAEARRFLSSTEPPTRRAMALDILEKEFQTGIDFSHRFLYKPFGSTFSAEHLSSILEVYEAGRLGETWNSIPRGQDFNRVQAKAAQLPDVNTLFDKAIQADFTKRRDATISLFKDALTKLLPEERDSLNFGAIDLLTAKGDGVGAVITSTYKGVRRDFAIYPTPLQVVRIPDIELGTPLGKEVSLGIDTQAFKGTSAPRAGVTSDVVLTAMQPFTLADPNHLNTNPVRELMSFDELEGDHKSSSIYESKRIDNLAASLVDTIYLRKTQFVDAQRGVDNPAEHDGSFGDLFAKGLKWLPGGSSLVDLYHGEYQQAFQDAAIDIALYATTEGLGKLWTLSKSGAAWAAAKISAKYVEKFGVKKAEEIALRDLTATTASQAFNSVNRMQGSNVVALANDKLILPDNVYDGAVARPGSREATKVSAIFQDDEWFAYNAKTSQAEGPALEAFLPHNDKFSVNRLFGTLSPEEQAEKDMYQKFESKVLDARKEAGYQRGYDRPKLNDIPGYTSNMGPKSIARLISESDFSAEQIGSLINQREVVKMDTFKGLSTLFKDEINAAGGIARPMPQTFHLSLTQLNSQGECAGLSTAMALALGEGSENTLLDNLFIATARPNVVANDEFLKSLTKLEETMMYPKNLHGEVRQLTPYNDIVKKMGKATTSTAWIISSEDHAMVAAARVDPKSINKKTWFFYEPSYGLAKFESEAAMKRGMNKLLNSGTIGRSHNQYGLPSKPIYGMSVFDTNNLIKNNLAIADVRKLSKPL
jgi:hypothetical protein